MLHRVRLRYKGLLLLASWTCALGTSAQQAQSAQEVAPTGRVSTPQALAIDPVTHKVYAVDLNRDRLLVLDQNTQARTEIAVGHQPDAVALDPALGRAYVVCAGSGYVSVIDLHANHVVATVPTDRRPYAIGVDAQRHKIFVTNTFSNQLTMIDGRTNHAQALPLGSKDTVLVDSEHGRVYFTSYEGTNVTLWDEARASASQLGAINHLWQLAGDWKTGKLFGASIGEDALISLSGTSGGSPARSAITKLPNGIAYDESSHQVLVTSYTNNTLSFADPATLRFVASLPTGDQPVAVAVDQRRGRAYVANLKGDSITVLDVKNRRTLQTLPAGKHPYAIAVDEDRGSVYTANYDGSVLTEVVKPERQQADAQ